MKTFTQFAAEMEVDLRTIQRWAAARAFSYFKKGGVKRVTEQEIERMKSKNTVKAIV